MLVILVMLVMLVDLKYFEGTLVPTFSQEIRKLPAHANILTSQAPIQSCTFHPRLSEYDYLTLSPEHGLQKLP